MRALVLTALALLCLGFEWEGRLSRLERALASGEPRERREAVRRMAGYSAAQVREPLLRALRDRDPVVRRDAAEVAGRVRLADAVPLLIDWLEDEDALVRATAASTLGMIRDARAFPNLVRALGDTSSDVRRASAIALGELGDLGAVVPLLGRLDDDAPEVRVTAAEVLARLGDPRAVVPLVGRARDESPAVRQAVYTALGDLADRRAAPALIASLDDDSETARLAAIAALGRLGVERAIEPLVTLLDGAEPRSARAALAALGSIGTSRALQRVIGALAVPALRSTAIEILTASENPELTASLAEALDASRSDDEATAIVTVLGRRLRRLAVPEASAALRRALDAGRGDPRVLLPALARSGDPSVLVTLLERLEGEETQRRAALEALGEYFERHPPDGRAADPLIEALSEASPQDYAPIVRLLGLVGAARALDAIRPLLDHPDPNVRMAAVEAIGAIGDSTGADVLLGLLDERQARLRFEAAQALGAVASPATIREILRRLRSPAPTDRHALLVALGRALDDADLDDALAASVAATLDHLSKAPDERLADRAIEALARWSDPRAERLLQALASRRLSAIRALRDPAPLRRALTRGNLNERLAAAARLGEVGDADDVPRLLEVATTGRWPLPAAAAFSLARLAQRGVHAPADRLCPLLRSHDAYLRANVVAALTAAAGRCPERSPRDYLSAPSHAAVVRVAAAHWLRTVDPSPDARALLARCAERALAPEVARACAATATPPADRTADVYAYAPDGQALLRERLVALRFDDGSALVVETDANGHVRWERAPRGQVYLDDPLRTPLQP